LLMRTLRRNVKWIMLIIVIVFSLSILGYYGFGTRGQDNNAGKDYAVAKVDGQKILRSTMDRSVRDYVQRAEIRDLSSKDLPGIYKKTLDNLVIQAALRNEVEELGIKASEAEIDEQIDQIEDQFPTKEAFQQYIERNGIKMDDLRESVSNNLSQMQLLESVTMDVSVTEEEMKKFYEDTKGIFFTQPSGIDLNIAEFSNRDAAEHVLHLLRNDFSWDEASAQVDSEDILQFVPYEETVFIPESRFVEQLQPLSELGVLDVSDVIEVSSDDYALFLNRGYVNEKNIAFEEVSGDVKEMLISQKEGKAQQKYLDDLKASVEVEILDPELFATPEVKENAENPVETSADNS